MYEKTYEIKDVYFGDLRMVVDVDEKEATHRFLKSCIFCEKYENEYVDLETLVEYSDRIFNNKIYNINNIGKIIVYKDSLKPIIQYFIENNIPYKNKMTSNEIMNALSPYLKGIYNIDDIVVGDLIRIEDKEKKSFTKLKEEQIFYYKKSHDSYVDLDNFREYKRPHEITNGLIAVHIKKTLKELLKEYNIEYKKSIMNKSELKELLKELNNKKNSIDKIYKTGVNVDEDVLIKLELCGNVKELEEFLKGIKQEFNPRIIKRRKVIK